MKLLKKAIISLFSVSAALLVVIVVLQAAPFTNYVGKQTARFYNEIFLYNTTGTAVFSLNNSGQMTVSGTAIAKIDSFSATLTSDTTVMTGASIGDVIVLTRYNPAHSATQDTGCWPYSVRVLNTDSVLISRIVRPGGSTAKSGAQYMLHKTDK